jgi:putative FmdB family regulatory protein
MPIYTYRCLKCKHEYPEIRKIGDANKPTKCPECGSKRTERTLTIPGGYHINGSNSASVRPRSAGYRKDKK